MFAAISTLMLFLAINSYIYLVLWQNVGLCHSIRLCLLSWQQEDRQVVAASGPSNRYIWLSNERSAFVWPLCPIAHDERVLHGIIIIVLSGHFSSSDCALISGFTDFSGEYHTREIIC